MDAAVARPAPEMTGILTFLFTDLAGSTKLWERHPTAMRVALARHDEILRTAITGEGGRVVKTTGDGLMAVFASAGDGIAASLTAQRGLAAERWAETGPLRVRMGLHAGEAEIRADDYFGPTVNRTARIMAVASGGQVLLSAAVAALAADGLPEKATLLDLGEHRLKDLGRSERVFQLVHPDLDRDFPALVSAVVDGADLPALPARFIGRAAELAEIGDRLSDPAVRLLTLTGPGGTGKTSLAIEAASRARPGFPDGIRFADLSACHEADAFLASVAHSVGLDEILDGSLVEALIDRLRDLRLLLVLDNFEQVAAAAGLVARLSRELPALTILVTSREALHVRAEQVYPVPPMTLPPTDQRRVSAAILGRSEAVQLFVDRAREARPDFELTDANAAAVGGICRRLDGLPLAIELAAARLRLFSPEALHERLGRSLELLKSASRDLPERQQTLRATIEWSYELLDAGEQRLFEALAAFDDAEVTAVEAVLEAATASEATRFGPGPADGAAEADRAGRAGADAAADDAPDETWAIDPVEGLASLLEKNLVRQVDVPDGEPRLTMLQTIREYAVERLDRHRAFGRAVRRAHAAHYAETALRLRADLGGVGRDRALIAATRDIGNLRIAWAWWLAERDLDELGKLADTLLIINEARSWYQDTVHLTTDMLEVLSATPSSREHLAKEIALRTTLARARLTTSGYTPEVEDDLVHALSMFTDGGAALEDGAGVAQHCAVLRSLANLHMLRAEFVESRTLGERMIELAERHDLPGVRADGGLVIGANRIFLGDLAGGLQQLDAAIESFESMPRRIVGYRPGSDPRVICLATSAFALWLLGRPDRAADRARQGIELSDGLGHPFTSAYARFHAGLLHLFRREPEVTLERALGVLEIADEHDTLIWRAVGGCLMGAAQAELGRADDGLARVRAGLELYRGIRTPPVFWPMLRFLEARACLRAGQVEQGLETIDEAIAIVGVGPGGMLLAELELLKGDLLAGRAESSAAGSPDTWYRRALDAAVAIGAVTSQLRAATRLARREEAGGEAHVLLGELLAGLTDGLQTSDVLDARAVVEAR